MIRTMIQSSTVARSDRSPLLLPTWITARTGLNLPNWSKNASGGISIDMQERTHCALVSARIADAGRFSTADFRGVVIDAYGSLFAHIAQLSAMHPVRFWNFLPSINQDMGGGQDRYMVFNAGRFKAFESRHGSRETFDQTVATASGVGHGHPDLFIHCLVLDRPGKNWGNPRQIAPFRYSEKFGPLPPCFARATSASLSGEPPALLVGGTASIRGEESLHKTDLDAQFDETLRNLSSLVQAAMPGQLNPLACFTELRVYHRCAADAERLGEQVRRAFPNVKTPQFLRADLCRAELLVEIEGVAEAANPA